jgi:hypothetical protein
MQCFIGFQNAILAGDFKQGGFGSFHGFSRVVGEGCGVRVRPGVGAAHPFLHWVSAGAISLRSRKIPMGVHRYPEEPAKNRSI